MHPASPQQEGSSRGSSFSHVKTPESRPTGRWTSPQRTVGHQDREERIRHAFQNYEDFRDDGRRDLSPRRKYDRQDFSTNDRAAQRLVKELGETKIALDRTKEYLRTAYEKADHRSTEFETMRRKEQQDLRTIEELRADLGQSKATGLAQSEMLSSLTQELEAARHAIERQKGENIELQQAQEKMTIKAREVSDSLSEQDANLKSKQGELEQAMTLLDEQRHEFLILEKKYASKEEVVEKLSEQVNDLNRQLRERLTQKEMSAHVAQLKSAYEKEVAILDKDNKKVVAENKELTRTYNLNLAENEKLREGLDKLRSELATQAAQLLEMQKNASEAKQTIADLKANIDKKRKEIADLKEENHELTVLFETIKAAITTSKPPKSS